MTDKLPPITVLIADDHPIFRRGLAGIIEFSEKLNLVGEAENGEIALQLIEKVKPQVAIIDVDMPVLDGIGAVRRISREFPEVKTVFLTMHKDRQILNAMTDLNVKGYILKDSAVTEIVNCILQVVAGKNYFSPEIAEMLLQNEASGESISATNSFLTKLTAAETKILSFVAASKTNKEIAAKLFLSVRTVENHRFNICTKLGLKGNHALVKFALENKKIISS